ncbi:MAG: energy-coupling factor transporter transmembrane component T [Tissierellia bacterium]|nr:energy-coupling factor transporter transmembrane component T [Tissierellia bacterium]
MYFKNSDDKKIRNRLNPLTLILINAFIPLISMFFPSDKTIVFTLLFSMVILLVAGTFKSFLKACIFILSFWGAYFITAVYLNIQVLVMMFKMSILFLPCMILAYLLITEYNSSEILSSLEKLKLPKIFVIGITVTLRYIPTFKKEFGIIKEAMHIRGVKFSFKKPIQTFEYLIVPQLFRCLNLSSELTAAGLTKGINSPNKRSSYFVKGFSAFDYSVFIIFILGQILTIGKLI